MIVKCATTQLKPGMYTTNPGLSQDGNPHIYLQEGVLKDQNAIAALLAEQYSEAYVETEAGTYFRKHPKEKELFESVFGPLASPSENDTDTPALQDMVGHIKKADAQYTKLVAQCKVLYKDLEASKNIDTEAWGMLAQTISETETEMVIPLALVSRMRQNDPYNYSHSLNVALLATLAGRRLGYSQEIQKRLGTAGLLHDVGKVLVSDKILQKPGRLTSAEYAEVKKHPVYGRDILLKKGNVPQEVVSVVYAHHENYDGSGYPQGLAGAEIDEFASIVSILDTYDALRSDRYYREGISSHKALCVIYNLRGKSFSPELVDKAVSMFGIYPIGSIVVLRSGQKAFVTQQNSDNLLRPRVRVILDADNAYCKQKDIDLMAEDNKRFDIVDTLTNKQCRLHFQELFR
ncbi:MAG: HD-GYP domain-containing protein [Desulfovibrio sp.]|nr:HD-GYP domain-containing protein [Desulfovibrio sp.]MBI4961266.1 HD-GYP domain-containing protein [Desulfovibrio sp.]